MLLIHLPCRKKEPVLQLVHIEGAHRHVKQEELQGRQTEVKIKYKGLTKGLYFINPGLQVMHNLEFSQIKHEDEHITHD